jgi:hypothetical protein
MVPTFDDINTIITTFLRLETTQKTKNAITQKKVYLKTQTNAGAPEGWAVPVTRVAHVVSL